MDDEPERRDPPTSDNRPATGPRKALARRRATLLDVMVLVAATALGMALSQAVLTDGPWWVPGFYLTWTFHGPPGVQVACLASGLLVLRMVRPRPRWRRIVRQPGW